MTLTEKLVFWLSLLIVVPILVAGSIILGLGLTITGVMFAVYDYVTLQYQTYKRKTK